MKNSAQLEELYRARSHDAHSRAATFEARGRRIGNLRGAFFLTFLVAGGIFLADGHVAGAVISALALVVFLALVTHHDRVLEQEHSAQRQAILNDHALARVTGTWHLLPRNGQNWLPLDHPYAADLDLFGPSSLFQRISVAHTRYGQARLASWLLAPAVLPELQARQGAVRELAEQLDFRQRVEAEGMALVLQRRGGGTLMTDGPDPSSLLRWIRDGAKLPGGALLTLLSFALPAATTAGLFLTFRAGMHPVTWLAPFLLGLGVLAWARAATGETFAAVSTTEGAFLRYGSLLLALEEHVPQSEWLQERLGRLRSASGNAHRPSVVMNRFRVLVSWFDLRHNGMAYPVINGILLWDLHCTRALLRWRKDVGSQLEGWFDVIGEIEAISSLAGLLHDDPSSSLPVVTSPEGQAQLVATGLAHPLLTVSGRVKNDVAAFGPGEALLITGSNMSGKSTFLRALGVNAVLAFAGGPTCADSLSLPLCRLGSSLRIADSLAGGISHFYAEVQKLARVVSTAAASPPVLFLLDEILHGTNSRERQVGARWVLAELLQSSAFGVITTHDMELCRLPDALMPRVRQHHFREDVRRRSTSDSPGVLEDEMTFDYTLREGPVTSGNALRLMRRVGLAVPLEDSSASDPG